MSITSVTSAGATGADAGRARLAESFDTFLSLLTTQLKNQDPLAPMDSNQFTQQIVQMTGVEQQLLTNDLLKKLVGNTSTGISQAVSMIGKEVRVESDTAGLAGGQAQWIYTLDRAATDVKIEVIDPAGRIVHVAAPTRTGAGDHTLTWDGKEPSGATAPDGPYRLRVTATDSEGQAVPVATYIRGLVSGVEQRDGQTLLSINGAQAPWEMVTAISQPAPAPAGAPPNPGAQ